MKAVRRDCGGFGNHQHCNRLVSAEDIDAIQVRGKQIKIALQVGVIANEDRRQHRAAGLICPFDGVAGSLNLSATSVSECKILVALAIRDRVGIGRVGDGQDEQIDIPDRVMLGCGQSEPLEGGCAIAAADGNKSLGDGRCAPNGRHWRSKERSQRHE